MTWDEAEPSADAETVNTTWIVFLLTFIIGSAIYRCFGPDTTQQNVCRKVYVDKENDCVETDQVLVDKLKLKISTFTLHTCKSF